MADFTNALTKGAERLVAVFIAHEIRLAITTYRRSMRKEALTAILNAAQEYAGTLGISQLPGSKNEAECVIERALPEAISILATSGMPSIHLQLQYAYLDEETLERASRRGLR